MSTQSIRYFLGIAIIGVIAISLYALSSTTPETKQTQLDPPPTVEATGEDINARREYDRRRLADPATGKIPIDAHIREMEFARSLPVRSAKSQALVWEARGPVNIGGRTRALAIDVTDEDRILAGGVSGGMWLSTDGGSSWTQTHAPAHLHSISSIVQDTRPDSTNIWYAGSGEFSGNSASGGGGAFFGGDGVFKSSDGGLTWSLLASTSNGNPQGFTDVWDYVHNVAFDPSNLAQSEAYAATYGTIFRSTDGGLSWSATRGGNVPWSAWTDVVTDGSGNVYAYLQPGGLHGGVYKSTDGINWTTITPTTAMLPADASRAVLAIGSSSTSQLWLLAYSPAGNHLLVYDVVAGTWRDESGRIPMDGGLTGNFDTQGNYDIVVSVHPSNDSTLFIGGTNLYRIDLNGASTTHTWIGGYNVGNATFALYPIHHPDQHVIRYLAAANSIISVNDGGIYRSDNALAAGNGNVVWQSLNNGYTNTQFYGVCMNSDSADPLIAGGMQDNGTWGTTSDNPTVPFIEEWGGDGGFCAIANAAAGGQAKYISAQLNNLTRKLPGPWVAISPTAAVSPLFINPYTLDPSDVTKLFYADGSNIYRSVNAEVATTSMTHWDDLQLTGAFSITALSVSTTNSAHVLYYGTSTGKVFRVDGADVAAAPVTALDKSDPAMVGGYVADIAIDPTNSSNVMVVFSNYNFESLWYTTDGGDSWIDVEGNLDGITAPSIRSAALMPGGDTPFLIGTSTGLYSASTVSASTTWTLESPLDLGNVVVSMVRGRLSDGQIVVATHGNGIYVSDQTLSVELNLFTAAPRDNAVDFLWRTSSEVGNAGFEIQYREQIPGTEYQAIGFVESAGDSEATKDYRHSMAIDPGKYVFRLKQIDVDGTYQISDEVELTVAPSEAFELSAPYPNPVNDRGTFSLTLKQAQDVEIGLFDVTGRQISVLHEGLLAAGDRHRFEIDAAGLASGTYFVRVAGQRFSDSAKITVVR